MTRRTRLLMSRQRRVLIHPQLARRIADFMSAEVWECAQMEQVHRGVFTHEERVLVVIGAAPISDPAEIALRRSKLLTELAVLQRSDGTLTIMGPRSNYTEKEWGRTLSSAVGSTRVVDVVLSLFEVMYASEETRLSCLAEASGLVAAALPGTPLTEAERHAYITAGGWEFLEQYEQAVQELMESDLEEAA